MTNYVPHYVNHMQIQHGGRHYVCIMYNTLFMKVIGWRSKI